MTEFKVYSLEDAPEDSKPILKGVNEKFGFVPNLVGMLAESPAALKGYMDLAGAVGTSSLNETEQQIVLMTASFENGCTYCMAAHSTISNMSGVPEDVVVALRQGTQIADAKLNALASFTRSVVRDRGLVVDAAVNDFIAAGYSREAVLDVVLGIAQKTISNYANHIAHTPVDEAFTPQAWEKPTTV